MRRTDRAAVMRIGAEPRAQLLPPEVRARQAARRLRGRVDVAVVLVLIVMVVAVGLASLQALRSQQLLQGAQQRTGELLAEQARFGEVSGLKARIAAREAAQRVGAAPQIAWKDTIDAVQALLVPGMAIETVTADSVTPLAPYAQASEPFAGTRVASLAMSVRSADVASVQRWLEALREVRGYVDATASTVVADEGGFRSQVVLHLGEKALERRFGTKGE